MSTRRFKAGGCVITEYEERYHLHCLHKVVTAKSKPNGCPQTETTSNDITFRSVYVSEQWTKRAPKSQRLPEETYTSVYKNDFKAWETKRPLLRGQNLHRVTDISSVNRGQQPFEGITCYRKDYVPHPVQPRQRRTVNNNLSSNILQTPTHKSKL